MTSENTPSPERAQCRSIPHITFIVGDAVFSEQTPGFLLERHHPVLCGLTANINNAEVSDRRRRERWSTRGASEMRARR
jgi:hypothetical protein